MEAEREGDIRVPLISFLFCLCLITGGVFLALYVFLPDLSKPWYPVIAFVLIGLPWIFWFFAYTYTFMKRCYGFTADAAASNPGSRQVSRRPTTRSVSNAAAAAEGTGTKDNNGGHQQNGGTNPSVASSKESETPLAYSTV